MTDADNIPIGPPGSAQGTLKGRLKNALSKENQHSADLGELCLNILNEFGGSAGLAREVWQSYTDDCTPATRATILKNVLGLLESQARITKDTQRSESAMSEQELLEQAGPLFRSLGIDHSQPPAALPEFEQPTVISPDVREDVSPTADDGESPNTCAHHPV